MALFASFLVTPCVAFDGLGTAGPIHFAGGKQCGSNHAAITKGECDPPQIDLRLPVQQRSKARVERARELVSAFRIGPAIQELTIAVDEDPNNAQAFLLRGRLRIPGNAAEIVADIKAALELDPENPDALATRAFVRSSEEIKYALQDVTKALTLAPNDVDALWIRAMLLARTGNLDEAERDLDRAIAVEPDHVNALLSRAALRMQTGNPVGAESDASAVLTLRYGIDAMQIRAIARARCRNYSGALDDLNGILGNPGDRPAVIQINEGDFVDLLIQRALLLTRTGKLAEAKADLGTIVAIGGKRSILQIQVYLRRHGFPDIELDGKRSDQLDDALVSCFVNDACERGLTIRG